MAEKSDASSSTAPASGAPESKPEFSRPIRVVDLDRAPRVLKGEADEAERKALAARFGLTALDALSYELELRPWRDGGWRVKGVVRGDAVQACVVTLAPVPEHVEDRFERGWLPARAMPGRDARPASETELYIDPELDDSPDLLGDSVDLGEAAAEAFGLALDPYPRAPGAEEGEEAASFTAAPPGAEPIREAEIHPFARLKGLKGEDDAR